MISKVFATIYTAEQCPCNKIPVLEFGQFQKTIALSVQQGSRISALFARPQQANTIRLYAVLAGDFTGELYLMATDITGDQYPSITPICNQAHWFEREIAEQWGIVPKGHPWLKPIRFHESYNPGYDAWNRSTGQLIQPGVTDFFRVDGREVHEVAVGPVHAGIIEPGHFRFQCHGEKVFHLEISLGYQHRGIERAILREPAKKRLHYMETCAGDTTIGHTTAYCRALEILSQTVVPPRAQAIGGIALELERIANHIGDLGALAADVGYLPTHSFCGRIRGDALNLSAELCGSRFGRGLVVPGGVAFDLDDRRIESMLKKLDNLEKDAKNAIDLLWNTPSVMNRFEDTGAVPLEICNQIGLVGVAARACGADRDIRKDFPDGIYCFSHIPTSTADSGDVFGRAVVRWLEVDRSITFIKEQLTSLPQPPVITALRPFSPNMCSVSLVEGWRGEICHVAMTGPEGTLAWYKIVDPSFHNWFGLAYSLRNQQISDFPLCNKSFNLSYCGHDL